jgi:hypothetical protein
MFMRQLALGAALAGLGPAGPALAQQGQFLVHEASGLCVDVSGAPGVNNGARLQLWQCETANNRDNGSATDQKWFLKDGFVRNALSARCMDVPGAPGVAAGTGLQLWDCEASGRTTNGAQTDQQFDHVNGQFRHRVSGQCIGPERTDYRNGVRLVLMRCAKVGAADLEFSFRAPGGATAAAAPAAKPAPAAKKRLIYPDVAGASQTCVMPVDEKTRRVRMDAGARLMLVACSADNASAFALANRQLVLAARPDLCVTVSAGARQAHLVIDRCQDSNVTAWEATGTSTAAARIRVAGGVFDNQCWSIPRLADPANPPLPYDLVLKDCGKGDMRFFVE